MEFLQEMVTSFASHCNPAYMHTLGHEMQEHSPNIDAAAVNVFSRSHYGYIMNGELLGAPGNYHHQLAEGMDETTLLQPPSNPHLHHIADSPLTNSLGLSTDNSTSRQQFCEISNSTGGSASAVPYLPCKIKRRSWQEALSSPLIQPKIDIPTSTQLHLDNMHQVECTSVDNIFNLQHIQAGANIHRTDTNYLMPKTLLTTSATHRAPLEEPVIAAREEGMPAQNPSRRSFLSALNDGDEAFFRQQLLVPMGRIRIEDPCKEGAIKSNDHEEVFYDHFIYDPDMLQYGFDDHIMLQPGNLSIAQLWPIHNNQSTSVITDPASTPSKNLTDRSSMLLKNMINKSSMGSSCASAPVNMSKPSNNDEKIMASQEINASRAPSREDIITRMCSSTSIDAGRSETQYDMCNGGSTTHKAAIPNINPVELGLASKKRSFNADDDQSALYVVQSKRAHLGPHGKHANYNMMRHSSSSSSLNMQSDSSIVISGTHQSSSSLHSSKSGAKPSSRNPLGPALNTNLKPRARQGTANDPQTVAARNRRERISARLKVLQDLVPNGSKVDLVTMLEKAINYVKFLQLQLRVLSNDELWQANQLEKVEMQHVVSMDVEDDTFNINAHLTVCEHTSMSCTTNNTFHDQP